MTPTDAPVEAARRLIQGQTRAALGTSMGGWPYVSLILCACDQNGAPLLLLSDLAQHAKNILTDARISLLFDATAGSADPLTGERLTVLGTAAPCDEPGARARYLERHPSAARYAGFSDFRLYRVRVERGHLVAGFGRIDWIEGEALRGAG